MKDTASIKHRPAYNMKALILVDIQNGLTSKKALFEKKLFLDTINSSIKTHRDSDSKIIFIQHNNNQLKNGTSDWEIDQRIDKQKHDILIQKKHGNAFQKTDLKQILLDYQINSIIIGGLVSQGCVKATCLGGLRAGFETSILKNGHTNWNKDAEDKITETEQELVNRGVLLETTLRRNENMDHVVYLDAKSNEFDKLLDESKTMIIRGATGRKLPYGRVKKGDVLYFINNNAEGVVKARAIVYSVYNSGKMNAEESVELVNKHHKKLLLSDKQFQKWAGKRYLVLIEIAGFIEVDPFAIDKSNYGNMDDWWPVENIESVKK